MPIAGASMFDHPSHDHHEGVHMFHDAPTGLRLIIAVHSTTLGPAAGGCRMWDYKSGEAMLADALRLSQGMSYKNAMADLPLGGGKAVIWGNSRTDKTPELFRAFGRAVESLNGKYWTAEDVGISPEDLIHTAKETSYVAGLETGRAASGDPSPVTAKGVFLGLLETVQRAFGKGGVEGKTIAVQGVGHVGADVCRLLAKAGAELVITDVNEEALYEVSGETGARIVRPDEIYDTEADVFSPCALGAVINPETLPRLKVKAIAGAANNQLSVPAMGDELRKRGILYAPDYVINGGGIINVAAEISGVYSREWVDEKLDRLMQTLGELLDEALARDVPTNQVADRMAKTRLSCT